MISQLVNTTPQLKRGRVWCRNCGNSQRVDAAACIRSGWPECCGYTMTIDSPEEQAAMADRAAEKREKDAGGQ